MEIRFLKLDASALKPEYKTKGASGMDIAACLKEKVLIAPHGGIELIPTGIAIELPYGYEAQLRPRSGLALSYGISMPNSPATIDSDYRGEIKVILINLGKDVFIVNPGDRIAQMIISKIERVTLCEFEVLYPTKRGENGFGHTGV